MASALGRANYWLVAAAVGIYLLCVSFWAARWQISLSTLGYPRRLRDLYLVIFGGIFVNNLTPFTYAGGDPVARAYILNKTQWVPYPSGFATIMAEFVLDLPIFLLFLTIGLFTSVYVAPAQTVLFTVAACIVLVVISLSIFHRFLVAKRGAGMMKRVVSRVLYIFGRRAKETRIDTSIEDFYTGAHTIIGRWRVASLVCGFSATLWILGMVRLFVIFQALNYPPSIPVLMLAVTLPAIVGLIPLLPGGLGTVDATMASIFLLFGVPAEIAVSATLIERAITLIFGTAIGACATSYLGLKVWEAASKGPKPR